jgi:hypothetical protein
MYKNQINSLNVNMGGSVSESVREEGERKCDKNGNKKWGAIDQRAIPVTELYQLRIDTLHFSCQIRWPPRGTSTHPQNLRWLYKKGQQKVSVAVRWPQIVFIVIDPIVVHTNEYKKHAASISSFYCSIIFLEVSVYQSWRKIILNKIRKDG